jgi:hypothetical protein
VSPSLARRLEAKEAARRAEHEKAQKRIEARAKAA